MYRIFVERKKQIDFESKNMKSEIIKYLKITSLTDLQILNGYDIFGISDNIYQKSIWSVFAEKGMDIVHEKDVVLQEGCYHFDIEYLPGQYDQRADFAQALIKINNPSSSPTVKTFKKIILHGNLTKEDINIIKSYYINPVEAREIPVARPLCKTEIQNNVEPVKVINGFSFFNEKELEDIKNNYSISLSIENLKFCQEYYKKEKTHPTVTELKIFDTYWSDHCRHSTFLTKIENLNIEKNTFNKCIEKSLELFKKAKKETTGIETMPSCLMDIATAEMKKLKKLGKLDDMEDTDEVNACSIETKAVVDGKEQDYIVMFKNETHNHPTEMEPFGGASTCLGGGIRDPLSGRAHVYGAIRLTGASDPREPYKQTLKGKLPQRKITKTAAEGYSSYGNQIGLASGHLLEFYDPGFKAKRMECGALVAAAPKENITRGNAKPSDVVVLLGGNTGRDGLGGATGSSKEQDENALYKNGAEVQKGNPIIERNIVRLFRNKKASKLIKKCNDFGAGGVCVAIGELADGLIINLDNVPTKYSGLSATELALSESQERMAILLDKTNLDEFIRLATEENLNAVKVADVTDNNRVVMTFEGKEVVNISREFLNTGGIRQKTNITVSESNFKINNNTIINKETIHKDWLDNLTKLNVCSKKGIANRFDTTASNSSVFLPFGGKNQLTPEQGLAMKISLTKGSTNFGTLMTVGYNPDYCYKSPFHAALYAVLESVAKIVTMGGDYKKTRLSFQEFFEKLGNDEKRWGKPFASLLGAFYAQDLLEIPSIGGKDSMSGTFHDIDVPPSLISFAVATVDTTKLISRSFKNHNNYVVLIKTPIDEFGLPNFDILKNNFDVVNNLIKNNKIKSSSVVGMGGISAAISEMAFGNKIGFEFDSNYDDDLFNPSYANMLLEIENISDIKNENIDYTVVGKTTKEEFIKIFDKAIPLNDALSSWQNTLEEVFETKFDTQIPNDNLSDIKHQTLNLNKYPKKQPKPVVLIPIFPGSTGEYELEKHFLKAGADVKTLLFKNQNEDDIKTSFENLTKLINTADMLAIPSGYSAGGEPNGTAKLITSVLTNNLVSQAINNLIERKGLVLGIGEGFKALLNTGLIEHGKIEDNLPREIFITKNPLNQYWCQLANVKVISDVKPWFNNEKDSVQTVPISSVEGMVFLDETTYKKLSQNGQITTKYVDCNNNVSVNTQYNPFGSYYGIESIVSKNGQILGRMALIERLEDGLYKNVNDIQDNIIFKNIVNYFKGIGD